MRSRLIRVRRKHARSMRFAMLFFVFSLAIYLITFAFRLSVPPNPQVAEPVGASAAADKGAAQRVTLDVRFDALSCFLVELGSYDSAEAARIEAARYVLRGAAGYIWQQNDTFCVIGACYEASEEAHKIAERLSSQEQLSAKVLSLSGKPVALRITATQAQIDALVEAEHTVRRLTAQLGDISYGLDGGVLGIDAAQEQLSRARVEAELRYRALERAAGEEQNEVVQDMLMLVGELRQSLADRIAGSDSALLSFSAKIKYNKIGMRIRHAALLNKLGA